MRRSSCCTRDTPPPSQRRGLTSTTDSTLEVFTPPLCCSGCSLQLLGSANCSSLSGCLKGRSTVSAILPPLPHSSCLLSQRWSLPPCSFLMATSNSENVGSLSAVRWCLPSYSKTTATGSTANTPPVRSIQTLNSSPVLSCWLESAPQSSSAATSSLIIWTYPPCSGSCSLRSWELTLHTSCSSWCTPGHSR